jgi:flagellar hook protein FlgE
VTISGVANTQISVVPSELSFDGTGQLLMPSDGKIALAINWPAAQGVNSPQTLTLNYGQPTTPSAEALTAIKTSVTAVPPVLTPSLDYSVGFPPMMADKSNAQGTTSITTTGIPLTLTNGTTTNFGVSFTPTQVAAVAPLPAYTSWAIAPQAPLPANLTSVVVSGPTTVPATTGTACYDASGNMIDPGTGKQITSPNSVVTMTITDTSGNTYTMSYDYASRAMASATGSTQNGQGNALTVRSTNDETGQAPGSFKSASVDNNGNVVFSYSNGHQLKPYKIPLVTFNDPDNLQRITGATFAGNETLAGKPSAQWAGTGDTGTITASSVEQSNVDIADELTKMIVAQRSYSSNGKVITTADQMTQEALQFVR